MTTRRYRFPWVRRVLALVLRMCPAGRRFQLAEQVSSLIMRLMPARATHDLREATLWRLLDLLTRNGTTFPVPLDVSGGELMTSAIESGAGVLVVTTHSVLNSLVLRYLHDLGQVPAILATDPHVPIIGTRSTLDGMCPSVGTLRRIRRGLAEGRLVCAMIDCRPANAARTAAEFVTAAGEMRISTGLLRMAMQCGARILFTYFHLGPDGRIVAVVGGPDRPDQSLGAVTDHFKRFVQAQADWAASLP